MNVEYDERGFLEGTLVVFLEGEGFLEDGY
jgi:hypothetical protein